MKAYLPVIQGFLSDWYHFTLDNAWYAACIAGFAWLLTAGLYSLRISGLKKTNKANEKLCNEQETRINTAQQQITQLQDELRVSSECVETEKSKTEAEAQRALDLENHITQHKQQLAESAEVLTAHFDLDVPEKPAVEGFETTSLWQYHRAIIEQLTERLRAEQQITTELQQVNQAETAKLAVKEELITTLESRLGEQARQLAQLESDLEERNIQLQQQQDKIQQLSAESKATHGADSKRLKELEQQSLEWENARQQVAQLEEKIKSQGALIQRLESDQRSEPIAWQPEAADNEPRETQIEAKQTHEESSVIPESLDLPPQTDAEDQADSVTDKFKHWLGVAQQRVLKRDQQLTEQEATIVETEQSAIDRLDEVESVIADRDVQAVPSNQEQQPLDTGEEQEEGLTGKFKNLFGLSKSSAAKKEPEAMAPHQDEDRTEQRDAQEEPHDAVTEQSGGVIKKLLGIGSKAPEKAESQAAERKQSDTETHYSIDQHGAEIEADDASAKIPARLKGLWGKLTSKGE